MAKPGEKLAKSLSVLKKLQVEKKLVAIQTSEISRTHRERLTKNGFLKEVAKGWYVVTNPSEQPGDSTSWYTSYWKFCSRYLKVKYGTQYCISAEQSILLYAGNETVPKQMVVRAPQAPNLSINLLHGTSLFLMKSPLPNIAEVEVVDGIRRLTLPSALIHCKAAMFKTNTVDIRTALSLINNSADILKPLLEGSHTVVAGRLAGAFRNNGQERIADDILKVMKAADYRVIETDPFESKAPVFLSSREKSPYVKRVNLMWQDMRKTVLKHFPKPPGIRSDHESYLKYVDEIYTTDAYHSLSIERYVVSAELIEQVRTGEWNIEGNDDDRKLKDAMAARGYWQASQIVKDSIRKVLEGENPGQVVDRDHGDWYLELFGPSVTAGLLNTSDLAGYRSQPVFISQSLHVPMKKEAIRDTMPLLFELLEAEKEPAVRAVLGHFVFVYIHPYMDGNGRMGRFLMNVMLASGGYPWTVIPVEEQETYMKSLEKASVEMDIESFAKFIAYLVENSLKGTPIAKLKS